MAVFLVADVTDQTLLSAAYGRMGDCSTQVGKSPSWIRFLEEKTRGWDYVPVSFAESHESVVRLARFTGPGRTIEGGGDARELRMRWASQPVLS